ncbi:hypothetical protein RN053_00280, partial [Pantoea dispersa]|uniref:hypothetical protein n=1 Tax=Pantoea dispersa TaxID=59814 RepID=UPI0028DF1499
PPFYRLNYRGIVGTRRILAMPIPVVKARSHTSGLSARKSSGLLLFCLEWADFKLPTRSHFKRISFEMLDACQSFVICRF